MLDLLNRSMAFDHVLDSTVDERLPESSFGVSLDSFEGPLSLLLILAQKQKIDLNLLSLREIASQYVAFVYAHKDLEESANYLRMASYLTWLKSRRLLPQVLAEEESSVALEEQNLLERLQHLKAMRDAGEKLDALPQLGIHFWGKDEYFEEDTLLSARQEQPIAMPDLTALLQTYGKIFSRKVNMPLQIWKSQVLDMDAVFKSIERKLRRSRKKTWMDMTVLIPFSQEYSHPVVVKSCVSATLMTILFLCHQGKVSVRQNSNFSPIYVKHEYPSS